MKTFPLLQSQLGIFMEWSKDPSVTQYNLPTCSKLSKTIDVNRLQQALERLTRERSVLRTHFVIENGEPRQYVDDQMVVPVVRKTMSDQETADYIDHDFVRPFDLLSGEPLLRLELIETETSNWLLVDIHHSIGDGVTLAPNMTIYDIPAAYNGDALEETPYGMYEYAEDEQASFGTKNYERAAQYYKEKFAGIDFVTLAGNPDSHLGNMVRESAFMPVDEVDKWCAENGTSSNLLYMAAFSLVMSRFSREKQVAYYSVNHGRMDKRLARAYGMFVKSVPILADVNPEEKVIDFIKGFRRELMSTIRYGVYPFNHFCRDLGVKPMVSFGFQGYAMQEYFELEGERCTSVQLPKGKIDDDMSCVIYLRNGQYDIRMESSDALNSKETLRTVADAVKHATEYMMAHPEARLDEIELLSSEEQATIAAQSQGRQVTIDSTQTFPSLFMAQAAKTPSALAVVDEKGSYTYEKLNAITGALASRLLEMGVEKNHFVSIMLGYQKEFVVAALGVEKCGGAYVPLDYDYPNDRLLYMLEDSESQVLITSHPIFNEKNAEGEFSAKNILFIDDFLTEVSADSGSPADQTNFATPDSLAYMIYTSGSTGKPKGVMIPHRAKANFVQFIAREWGHTQKSHICCHSSFSFDASIEDLYPVLTVGGTLYTVPQEARKDMELLHDFILKNGITGGCYTTQLGQLLLQMYPDLPVDYLVVGGEKMTANPDCRCRLINTYGPTEFTVDATFFELKKDREYKNIPIGRPLDNLAAYVVDAAGHLLPLGMAGELCMAGAQMAAGYWKREDLTAEKFSDIMVNGKQVKVYHTGDLVRYNSDGDLEYMGRIDNQVKLRGFRIELGEIETLIGKYEGVDMQSVQVKEVGGVQHLVAYYSARTEIDKSALERYLSESLTEYMVPDVYMQLDEMPLTPNGKVDTKALPEPEVGQTEYVEPEGEKEILVASCIAQVLNTQGNVGALDSFFSLGGDSIKSIRLVSLLRQKGLSLSVADVMKGNTVRGIAALAEMGETIEIPQESVEGEILQGAIMRYFFNLNLPHAEHYNQSVAFESAVRLDTKALRAALDAVVNHHDMLRMRAEGSNVYINKPGEKLYDFVEEEVKTLDDIEAKSNELQSKINLTEGPVLKVALFHTPEKDVVVMICHHLAVDGVSWRIIAEDLNVGYQMSSEGREITLPKKTHSYKYYAEAIARYRDSYALSKEKTYWETVQKKMEKLPQGGNNGTPGQMQKLHSTYTNDSIRHLLTDAHQAYGTNENDLLVTALVRSYRKLTGNDSASILMEGHGREPIHEPLVTDRTVGWFTSAYPIVVEHLNGDIRHDVRTVKETFRNVPNKGLGYGVLQYIPSNEGDTNLRIDLTELLGLNYLGELTESGMEAVLNINTQIPTGMMVNPEGVTGPAFMIDCSIAGTTLNIEATYDSKVWTADQADEMVKAFCDEIETIVAHTIGITSPETTASDLGATGWTDEQYEKLVAAYASRGERMERIYPLSPMQEGMLLEYMMNPETTSYVLLDRFAMSVLPTEEQMRYVLDALAAKHEVFRTSVIYEGVETPCQAIINRKLGLKFVDISEEPDIMAASKRIHEEELHSGFNLQTDPLFRVVVMKTSSDSCHILLCTHHIIVDGWCLPIYLGDFFNLLTETMKGGVQQLPEPEDQGRYEEAIRNMLALDKKTSMAYWKTLVGDYCEKAVIPYSTDDMTTLNPGEVQRVSISAELLEKLKATAGTCGVTLNTIVELVWGLVLQTYNRSSDVIFGKVVSGRNRGDVTDLVGLFINTVPVRVRTEGETTVPEALRALQQQASETNLHDYCPLSAIQQLSELGSNLYQSRITFENYEGSDTLWNMAKSAGVTVLESEEVNFSDLHVTVGNSATGDLQFSFTYNGQLYSEDTIGHVKELFCHLLEEIAANADRKIRELSLLSDAEKTLLKGMRCTAQADVPLKLHHQPIEKNAIEIPDVVALIAKDCTLTFRQFNEEANRIAHALIERGVKRGDRVVLLLPRTSAVIVSMFGVSKTGAAYIPCDPAYPADRINLIMTDSEAQYVITTKEHTADYAADKVILIDDIYKNEAYSTENPQVEISPEDLAYLIYTSGSTGRPKGVMLRHVGITNYLYNHPANIHVAGLKRLGVKTYVSITTLSFDMSLKEFAGSLYNGITTVLADEQEVMDPVLLAELMKRTGAEAINGTCSRIQSYLELPAFCEAISHCKMVWSGGEMYPMALLKKLQSLGVEIINTYGPTEITVSSNIANLTHAKRVNVGRPLLNYVEYIVDQYNREVPVGVPGELLIGGPGVAVGYNNLPEMTAERFVEYQGVRVYRSGDLARWVPDGSVEILGRNDDQVKLRGFRVELGEIEGVAVKFVGLRQAVADIKEIGAMQHLCLYYTSDEELDEEALKAFLAESLTEYMVPTAYVRIDAIPLTPNGKTNRKALPIPKIHLEEIVPPANETEAKLLELMKQQLKTDELGVTTNLVTMGLSSIAAMRLCAILLQQYEIKIPVKDILEHPTVREMAQHSKHEKAVQYNPYPIRETYPLSESQRGMLIDCLMNRDALQYNIPALLKYKTLDIPRFKEALAKVGEAHPYLKARIAMQGDDYVQVRRDDDQIVIEEYTLDYDPDRAFFQAQIKPFDVLGERLYRFKLYTTPSYYYLVIDIHHIISDGSSNYILAREMEKAYSGQPLVKESYTAFDRAIDEENIMKTERGIEAEQYFDNLINGTEATVYPLSTDTGGDAVYGELLETFPSEAIDKFCKQHALAPSSFFLTVFHHVLHRVTREERTLLYFISNGRSEVQLENFFGVFVKTMPTVVSDYSSDIVTSVRNMHQQMLDTIQHDYYPFTKMVERHGLKAEILYNYFVDLQTNMALDNDAVEAVPLEWDTAKTPLSITMLKDNEGNYVSSLEYDSRLYSERDMLILNKAFRAFAENAVVANIPLSHISIISPQQEAAIKALSKGETMACDTSMTFPAIFSQQAAATPDAVAVVDEEGSYSYGQLDMLSNALAAELRSLGVGAPDVKSPFVSIMLGYEKAFLVAAIGVEKAGGAYVPLDYEYPNDRLLYMLEDSESQVLITSHAIFNEKTSEGDNFTAKNILFIDDFLAKAPVSAEAVNYAVPEGLAYMIYTSGSTGKPKGVMIPHRAKANFVQFIAKEWRHTAQSRICCHSSFSFDASIEDLYPVLTVGGTLYTVPKEARKDLVMLYDFIVKNKITGGCYTTQLGLMLLQQFPDLPVDYLVVGGEKMADNPDCKCRLINTYGPTEFTVDATFYETEHGRDYKNIPIGRPLYNLSAFVLDPMGQLVPQGVPGELCMAGPQIACGYWKREDLTAEKFVDCPFTEGKMYHTGDLVKYNSEGQIEYMGRIDNQVKLRGFRIELGEIETLISKYEGVQMQSVQVKEIGGVQHLCAYYTADRQIDSDALRDYLAEQLTDYMVPTAYMQLDQMPLTPNGKVNTKALPMPDLQADELVAPVTKTEKKLFSLAAEMLKHDKFGITSNLISMGLTSLTAMRFTVAAFNEFNVQVTVKDVMQHPTIHQMAALIDSKREEEGLDSQQEDTQFWSEGKHYYYPITENQRGVFFDWEMNRDTTQYNVPDVVVMTDADASKLRDALEKVVNAHPYLKTRFVQHDGDVMQIRRDEEPVEILMESLAEEPDTEFFQNRVRPFDLYNDQLYRLEIYTYNNKVYLFIDIHHSIYDGASSLILFDDIQKAYDGENIEPETYTAFEFALDELKLMKSKEYDEAGDYFKKLMGDANTVVYPHSIRKEENDPGILSVHFKGNDIESFCQQNGLTLNSYFLAITMHVLHTVTREDDIVITTINNGRSDVRMMNIMGMFVKTIPVVSSSADSTKSVIEVVKLLQNQLLETQSRDFYPFTKMVELYGLRPEIMYAYQPRDVSEDDEQDDKMRLLLNQTKLPLDIQVMPEKDGFVLELQYDTALYSKKDMEQLAEMMTNIAEQAASKPSLKDIPLLSDEDTAKVLRMSTGRTLDYDRSLTWIDQFQQQAKAHPDQTAVVDSTSQLTYRELDEKSDALAHWLVGQGVNPDDFVAVKMDRVKEFVVAVMAIQKAGAAYVPIDMDYPEDRISYMVENSEAKVMVTEKTLEAVKPAGPFKSLATPDSRAYMIYTSGSTGRPKGVMVAQRGLMNLITWIRDLVKLKEGDRTAIFVSFSFDASVNDLYPILTAGGELHIFSSELRKDMESMYKYLCEHHIKGLEFTTQLAMAMMQQYQLPIEYLFVGGEKLKPFPPTSYDVINVYGPTEFTDISSYHVVDQSKCVENIPIGKPVPNTMSLILDPYGRLLPQGFEGEICLSGRQMTYGYWKQEKLTEEKFADCPFAEGKMYHTGDIARYNDEGCLEYVGRIDNQVKLNGFRIELGGIEQRASMYKGILQVVAEVSGGKILCLYYTATQQIDEEDLKAFLGKTLAEYMVPSVYIHLDAMPMTPNGKVDHKKLPAPIVDAGQIIEAGTEIEAQMLDIAKELLVGEHIGVTTNLITAGMTSLVAMRMSAVIKQKTQFYIPVKDILLHPTIREMALLAGAGGKEETKTYDKLEYYPITENQRGVYIDWELNRDTTQYNLPSVTKMAGIDAEQLRDALVKIVEAHPYLKTRLAMKGDDIVQLRLDDEPVVVELTALNEEPTAEFFRSRVRPFNLFNDRLYRMEVYKTPTAVWYFQDIHHLVFDGASDFVLRAELEKALHGETLLREEYTAFERALDEKELMESATFNEIEKYFDGLLEDVEMISYPHSSELDDTEGVNNAYVTADVDKKVIDDYCRKHSATANSFFLTSLMQVLHRLTREERIAITTISNGRSDTRMHTIMGMFVKTLPVVSRLDGNQTFADALASMNQQVMTSIGNDIYPFTKIAERYKFRSEIMFVFQGGLNTPVVNQHEESIPLDLDTAKMPIAFMVTENDEATYHVELEYDTHLYSQADMQMLVKALHTFIQQALSGDNQIKEISLTDQKEQASIISLSQGEQLDYDQNQTFVDMVCSFAASQPEAIAVVDKFSRITYEELDRQSNTLAAKLIENGVQPDTFVGIMLPRQKEFIVALLSIMKAGAAYVPMDNEYPIDRLLYMLDDSRAKVLITTRELYEAKQQEGDFNAKQVIFMDERIEPSEKTVNLTHPDGLAYMIYTSGSTGKPKGVMLPHRALRAFLAWRIAKIGLTPESRNVEHPSFSFDASLDDLLCPLAAGGCVHILAEELRKDMDGIYNYLKEQRITGLSLSTALGMTMLGQFSDLPVKYIMMGGEKMLPFPKTPVKVINGYGPTEFTVCSSFHVVDQDKDENIPIGRPVPNSWSFICDIFGNLLPLGCAGELCLSGVQMANGYWQREDLTKEKFSVAPFGMKVYHTGDLVRWNKQGELEFLGRIDNQVKLRGFRIELGEIENQASLIEGIKAVAAEVREANGSKHLVLYFTAEQPMDTDAIRERLSESLTEYMVPDTYMQLDEMPLTPNGKVNRRALPQPVIRSAAEYVEPQTEAERIVAQAMQDVLGLKQNVGALDSFFAWGGDSIKSIRLVSRLRAEGITLQVADIMKLKTVREIAAAGSQGTVEISQEAWSGEVPQTAITSFFFDLNLPKPHHFNQTMFIKASQRVQAEALQQAIEALVKHHDMLRAIVRNGQLYVRNTDEPNLYGWEQLDYVQDADYVKKIERVCRQRQASISLSNGPLFKVVLFHTPDYDAILMVCHHLVVDGVSWRVLLEDFNTAYGQAAQGNAIALPAKTHSFREYAETLQSYAQSHELNMERTYWDRVQEKLQHLPSSMAKDCGRSMNLVNASLDAQTTHSITTTAGNPYHADINDLLMTALGRSYYKLTGNDAVSVQFEGHGREYIGNAQLLTDRTVGWFTSVYPVVLEHLDGDLRSCLRQTKETMHRIPNKGVGYNVLRYLSSDTAYSTGQCALIGFNYLGEMSAKDSNDGAPFTAMTEISAGDDFAPQNVFGPDISINCSVTDGQLEASLAYNTALFTQEQASQLLNGMMESLREITVHTADMKDVEVTATDLGEYEWTDEEFQKVYSHFIQMGTPLQRIYPLSPMQEGMALKFMMEPDSLAYRLVSRFALDILPTEEQMRYTLDQLGAKHEVLRTSLIYRGVEQYRQAIVDRPLELEMRDVTASENKETAMVTLYRAEQQRGFDMQDQSLFRIVCVKTSETTCEILLAVHHIIVDGWCIGLYMSDLIANLTDAVQGNMKPIEQYPAGRYERFIRNLLKKDTDKGLNYWKDLLNGYTTKAVIPYSGIVPEKERAVDNVCRIIISGNEMTALKALTTSTQTTMNTLVELAWGLVLQIYNRQDDAVFVKVVSGRNNASEGVEDVVGLFINSVPVRVRTPKGATVIQALQQLQQQAAESNEWDFCPLSAIQQQSDLGADLFQSIVAFENYDSEVDLSNDSTPFHTKMVYAKEESINDLTLTAYADGDKELTVNLEFDPTKYRKGEIEQVMSVMRQMLQQMAEQPDADVSTLPPLTDKDRVALAKLGMGETLTYDTTQTLVDLFTEQARKTPDNTCIVFQDKHLTFREVDAVTDHLAILLQKEYHVHPEMAVGVMIDRSELMLLYPMAIMKAGAAYMPLDFHFPSDRLAFMCQDAGVKLILSEGNRVAEAMPDYEGKVVTSDVFEHLDEVKGKLNPKLNARPENMFVILYTSGSTGTPKGVVLEHRNIVNFCHWYVKEFDVTAEDRAVAYANFGFDAHMMDIYPVTSVGGSVYIISSEMRMDLMAMNEYMEREQLNLAFMTTQVGYMFATTIENHSLRLLEVGGEKLQPLKKPPFRFYNCYGPTECTLYSTYYNVEKDYDSSYIGRPLAGYQLYVVDPNLNLVPQGAAGELIVAGAGVGRGYLNRPDQNAEKFITFMGQKAYRTGDLVKWSPDGNIDFIGRIDGQVKLRGLRIEMGEIEACILKYPKIKTTAVDVKEVCGAQHICCYFTSDVQIDADRLKEYLASKLTDYMVPTAYMQMEKLPLTPNGKVNRRALPVPSVSLQTENVAPETEREKAMFDIAKELLKMDDFGVTDDLTKLGLTSLLAIKMVMMAAKKDITIKLDDLMKQKSIRATLQQNMTTLSWAAPYDENKPVVVLVCGATPYKDLEPYVELLTQHYSLLVYEPIGEHYDYIFKNEDINAVVNMYYVLLELTLPEGVNVSAFTGHCFGGEIAYRMAIKWTQNTGLKVPMVMLDVFWRVDPLHFDEEALMKMLPQELVDKYVNAIRSYAHAMHMYDKLGRQGVPPLHDGDVVLFRATQVEPESPIMTEIYEAAPQFKEAWCEVTSERSMDNAAFWRQYYPDMEIYNMEAHHMSMLEKTHAQKYVEWIDNYLKNHQSIK